MTRPAGMKPVPGICDRCGLVYDLKDLKWEYLLGRNTGVRACPTCIDPSHPQLDTRNVKTNDKQSVPHNRSDFAELERERALFGFSPWVGQQATSTAVLEMGRVTVVIT